LRFAIEGGEMFKTVKRRIDSERLVLPVLPEPPVLPIA
jgi:hypothetical protein